MPAAKMTAALLEAHRGFQQDQDREEAKLFHNYHPSYIKT
jgi:hypothetical protein